MSALIVVFGLAYLVGAIYYFIEGAKEAKASNKEAYDKAYDKAYEEAYDKAYKESAKLMRDIFEAIGPEKTAEAKREFALLETREEKDAYGEAFEAKYRHLVENK